ncbi:MAG: hypothetical protein OQJ89_07710, partial [Kangiellaceae bacterium]|nr:hypothetical protein [Kangiellaceae bacterium]
MLKFLECKTRTRANHITNLLLVILLFLSIGFANSKSSEPQVNIERFKWNGQLPNTKTIIVKNYYGDISTKTITKPIVHLQSVYQR